LGLGLLAGVKPLAKPWLAIMDHSIDIGTKKALVVLRVPIETLSQRGKAIELKDCECIGIKISEQVNGESISKELEEIFTNAGAPEAIIKDCDYTLEKGVRAWSEKQNLTVPVIEDIGHVMANSLKKQFEKTKAYTRFVSLVNKASQCLRQTDLAFLIPPKLRQKGRFQSISKLGNWAEKLLDVLAVKGRVKKESLLFRLRKVLPDFAQSRAFIECFANTTKIVSQIMKLVKTLGLDKQSHQRCCELSDELPGNSKVKKRLKQWLQKHFEIQQKIAPSLPLLVSSDIIESLFGRFKYMIERSPQADMNRMALLIPVLCGELDQMKILQALSQVPHNELKEWEQKNIPYTLRKKRRAFLANK